jgi:hypothetical protein
MLTHALDFASISFTWREEITILERGEVSKKFVRDYQPLQAEDLQRRDGCEKDEESEK